MFIDNFKLKNYLTEILFTFYESPVMQYFPHPAFNTPSPVSLMHYYCVESQNDYFVEIIKMLIVLGHKVHKRSIMPQIGCSPAY